MSNGDVVIAEPIVVQSVRQEDIEPIYVVVQDPQEGGEPIELPTNLADNSLALNTLEHTFPGAHGLKFKNPVTGASRALMLDPSGANFLPPAGGWEGKLFTVILRPTRVRTPEKPVIEELVKIEKLEVPSGLEVDEGEEEESEHKSADTTKNGEEESETQGEQTAKVVGSGGQAKAKPKGKAKKKGAYKQLMNESKAICSDLIVLGLPYKLTEEEMKTHFEQFGGVTLCQIKSTSSGKSRGFGFVKMSDYESQIKVLSQTSHTISDRNCQVRLPLTKDSREPNTYHNPKLFINKILEKTTKEELKKFFEGHAHRIDSKATVMDVYIPKPFRGFAFVTLNNPIVAKELIRQADFLMNEHPVVVTAAAPKGVDPKTVGLPPSPIRPGPRLAPLSKFGANISYNQAGAGYDNYEQQHQMANRPVYNSAAGQARAARYSPYPTSFGQSRPSNSPAGPHSSYYDSYAQQQPQQQQKQQQDPMMMSGGRMTGPTGLPEELTPALSRMNPEVANAAMKAFWMVAQNASANVPQPAPTTSLDNSTVRSVLGNPYGPNDSARMQYAQNNFNGYARTANNNSHVAAQTNKPWM